MGGFFSSVQGKESGVIYLWGFFEYAPGPHWFKFYLVGILIS
jgi:hypothetical protein